MSKRSRRKKEKQLRAIKQQKSPQKPAARVRLPASSRGFWKKYESMYKKLILIPFILLALALVQIGIQTATTGDFINKGLTLKGGTSITVPNIPDVDPLILQQQLSESMPETEINIRVLTLQAEQSGVIVESDASGEALREQLVSSLEIATGADRGTFAIEETGSQIGERFFRQTFYAMIFAFVLMGVVVVIYFRKFIPSVAIILAAFSDIVITMAIANLLGIKLSTAGIAAFLMLIGYSVDSDMLLTTKLLKRKEGTVTQRTFEAFKTGIMMTATTIAALIAALIISESDVITQIVQIILIGLLVDLVMTWLQNVGILRWYIEKQQSKGVKSVSS